MKNSTTLKRIFMLTAVVVATGSANAQKGLDLNVLYNLAIPLGDGFRRYEKNSSFGSFQASVLYNLSKKVAVGAQMSYTDFHRQIGANEENIVKSIPAMARFEYTFVEDGHLKPFAGVAAGVDFIHFNKKRPGMVDKVNYTKSAFAADLGLKIPFKKDSRFGARVSTSYNLMAFKKDDIANLDSWNVQAGVSIPLTK